MADGFSLNIDDKFLQNLDKADAKLTKIVEKSEQMQTKVTEAFAKSSQGMQVFIDKLNEANTSLSKLGSSKIQNSVVSAIGKQASQSVDVVNKLINALNQLTQENAKMKNDESKRKKENSEVANINALYRERIKLMKQLEGIVQTGMKSGKVTEGESSSIASIRQRIQVVEMEIQAYNKRTNLSKEALRALMQGEVDYTLAEANEIRKRNKITEEETNKKKQEAEKQEQARAKAEERATKQAQAEANKRARQSEKEANQTRRQANKKAEAAINAAQREARALDTRNINAYNRAMASSEATITQRINKLAKLRQVQEQLSQDENKYANQLSKIRSEIERLTQANEKQEKSAKQVEKSHRNLMDTAGQLERKLALLFSVSAIQGYVSKLIEVRGEFEMQQRSLQVLLQNKDEANALWDKTVALAVKSPFRIKDLVTYTKQLAAYRVESDKLFETNRMLADVSAGLGVDMNRLILAYGQVKAANYLRGTELRQFSEAGVNMLGELAKYFSEVEGRAVSVGDVFERVSKRMVSFENVNEIFRRLTSEGGLFFKMQEKQSETLKGMVMNFRDSMDLMLNDIGKDQDSILKDSIRLAKEFVDNWRKFEPLMKTIGTSFLAAFGVKALMNIAKGLAKLWAIASAHPFIAIASAVALVVTYIYQAAQAQTKLNAAMQEVENENLASLEESIGLYKQLTQTINDTTKSYEERDKAMRQLESTFKDILPLEYTDEKYVKNLSVNYKKAEQAMLDYYNAKTREQKKSRVEQEFAGELEGTDIPELIKSTRGYIDSLYDANKITQDVQVKLNAGVSRVINSIVDDMKSGKLGASIENFHKEFSNRISKFSGIDWESLGGGNFVNSLFRQEDVQDVISTLGKYQDALESIEGLAYETYDQQEAAKLINQEKNNLSNAVKAFKDAARLYQQYVDAIPDATGTVEEKRKKIEDDVKKILTDLPKEMEAYSVYLKETFAKLKENADKGAFDFASALQTIESNLYGKRNESGVLDGLAGIAFNNVVLNENANNAAKEMVENFKEGLEDQSNTLKMTNFQKSVIDGISQITKKFGVDADKFAKFVPKYGEALSEVRSRVKSEIDNIKSLMQEWSNSISTGYGVLSPEVLTQTKQNINEMTKMLPALETFFQLLGGQLEGRNGKRNKLIDERIKVIDDMNKKYKELNKTLSKTEALQGAFDAYNDAFADAYGRSDVKQMTADEFASKVLNFPNENEIVKWLDNLAKTAKNKEDKIKVELAKGEYVFDMKVRVKEESDKALIDQIEDMFSGYEMSIELQKLNIPPDLAKQLFNIDALTLPELKNKVVSMESKFVGTDMEEEYRKFLEKIDEMEEKAQLERLKKYSKYLIKAQSERVKIKLEEMRQLAEIEKLGFNETQKEQITQSIQLETKQKMDKAEWEAFKDTDLYVQMFEDLGVVSDKVLNDLKTRLIDIRGSLSDLSPRELKEVVSQLEKVTSEQISRNPFENLGDTIDKGVKALKRLNQEQEEYANALKEQEVTQNLVDSLQIANKQAEAQMESAKAILLSKDATIEQRNEAQHIISISKSTINQNDKLLDVEIKRLAAQKGITEEAAKKLILTRAEVSELNKTANSVGAWGSTITDSVSQVTSMLENWGIDFGEEFEGVLSGLGQAFGALENIDLTKPMSVISGVTGVVAGLGNAFASIFGFGNKDKKKEKQIQREIKFVEDLQRAYEKLEKAIDNAYTLDTLKGSYDAAQKNIDAQIASYNKMIAAEEDKKKTDKDRIKEWQQAIEDLSEQRKELLKSQVEELGGGYDYSAMTEEFVSAWLDAFKETGNGLSGLEDNFEDFWQNIAIKQAVMGGASKIMQPFLDAVNKALENDFKLDDSEMANIDQLSAKAKEDMNAFLEQWYDRWGDFMTQGEQSELSGIQRGIQELTESTGQEIAAYLNSIRFFVAEQTTYLSQIASSFGNTEMENPMVGQLRIIASQTTAINELLNSLTSGGHSMGGRGFRVFIS